jgi:hypothetical protein
MNERIKLLAEQAEKYADDNFRGEPTWSEAFESKFANLILFECIKIAVFKGDKDTGKAIKDHFGVDNE